MTEQLNEHPKLLSDLDPNMPPEPIVTGRTLLKSLIEAMKSSPPEWLTKRTSLPKVPEGIEEN